jgi:Ca2+-binding EF-hand superfamily protein
VDIDGDGVLNQKEVLEIIQAQFPIDYKQAEKLVPKLWAQWDQDGNGTIDFEELVDPEHGLVAYMRRHLRKRDVAGSALGMIPDILKNRREWFFYFDDDRSGTLERAEVERAFVITFSLGDPGKAATMREAVGAVWPIFDFDGSNSIEMDEFLQADGLADAICAAL